MNRHARKHPAPQQAGFGANQQTININIHQHNEPQNGEGGGWLNSVAPQPRFLLLMSGTIT